MKILSGIIFAIAFTLAAQAQGYVDSLENLLTGSSDTTRVFYLNELTWEMIGNNNLKAISYARESIELSKKLDYQKGLANAFNYLGVLYQNTGDYDSSLIYLESAFTHYDKLSLESAASGTLNNIGVTLLYKGDFDTSLEYFYRALSTKEKLNDRKSLVSIYNNIGIIHAYHQNNDKALEYYLKSLEAAGADTTSIRAANTYNNVGLIYNEQKNYQMAMDYYNKSLQTYHRLNNKKGMAANFQNMASVHLTRGEIRQSEQLLKKALEINIETGDHEAMVRSFLGLGEIYFQKGQYQVSISYFKKARDKSNEIGTLNQTVTAFEGISKNYEKMGNVEKALKFYKQYKSFEDSLFSAESDQNISELREKYEAEKREQEIMKLNFDTELKEVEIKNQRFWLLVSITGLIIFIALSVIMILQRNQKNKAYKDLVRKNLENVAVEQKLRQSTSKNNSSSPVAENVEALEADQQKYKTSNLEDYQKEKLLAKAMQAMEQEKVFLDADMNVEKLASLLGTNKRYLSQVINELNYQNFSTFMNDYRIREARLLLLDPKHKHLTIETIAGMVGFNSKSAFNLAFKKFTGVTPSFFVKNSYKA